ncbi:MAG: MBOAT family protein, partial [Candidatus Omnitrophica bacterium]|nr:MBOAT family protein [Candidatus Omnitrophota bacterium]
MLFNSIQFVFFLPVVIILYYNLPQRWRNIMLLVASYYFYMCWKPEYIILILFSTLVDYYVGIRMEELREQKSKKKYLLLSLACNLGVLFAFKYFNFFNESFHAVFNHFNLFYDVPVFNVLLPVGISFYTFQTLSYSIDIYRGQQKAERNFSIFALYVSFFPQLVAGPIERSAHLLPQFRHEHEFKQENIFSGLKQIVWGFFKKLVVADRVAIYVDMVYNNPGYHNGTSLGVATVLFAFQIYCDFSGYSDIAIGSARLMGINLMENFKRPYFSKSLKEFWTRWHISLSTWFKDYVYIPLGGNRVLRWRWYYNLLLVFGLSGLWHGANWTFVLWGIWHGGVLICSDLTKNYRAKFKQILNLNGFNNFKQIGQVAITFITVCIGWVLFRSNSIGDAVIIFKKLLSSFGPVFLEGEAKIHLIYALCALSVLLLIESKKELFPDKSWPIIGGNSFFNQLSYAFLLL